LGDGAGTLPVPPAGAVEAPIPAHEPPRVRNARNYRITDEDQVGVGSLKQKARDNLAAIEVLQRLERETRSPTADELRQLVLFVGWGGLPQVFDAWYKERKTERERLEALLPERELESSRASTLNAHYTAPVVIRAMFAALQRFGFERGRILEPACGLGHFIGLMPEDMLRQSQITGIEIDSVTARLAKQLYPDADIRRQPFEEARLADSFFDVAISNIPFGDYRPFDARFKQWKFVIHDYFFAATGRLLVRPPQALPILEAVASNRLSNVNHWVAAAWIAAANGDRASFDRLIQTCWLRFGSTVEGQAALGVVVGLYQLPMDHGTLAMARALLDRADDGSIMSNLHLSGVNAALAYRERRYREALVLLDRFLAPPISRLGRQQVTDPTQQASSLFLRAMLGAELEDANDARREFAHARAQLKLALGDTPGDDRGPNWPFTYQAETRQREAEALFQAKGILLPEEDAK
jgi:hypothetical protein